MFGIGSGHDRIEKYSLACSEVNRLALRVRAGLSLNADETDQVHIGKALSVAPVTGSEVKDSEQFVTRRRPEATG